MRHRRRSIGECLASSTAQPTCWLQGRGRARHLGAAPRWPTRLHRLRREGARLSDHARQGAAGTDAAGGVNCVVFLPPYSIVLSCLRGSRLAALFLLGVKRRIRFSSIQSPVSRHKDYTAPMIKKRIARLHCGQLPGWRSLFANPSVAQAATNQRTRRSPPPRRHFRCRSPRNITSQSHRAHRAGDAADARRANRRSSASSAIPRESARVRTPEKKKTFAASASHVVPAESAAPRRRLHQRLGDVQRFCSRQPVSEIAESVTTNHRLTGARSTFFHHTMSNAGSQRSGRLGHRACISLSTCPRHRAPAPRRRPTLRAPVRGARPLLYGVAGERQARGSPAPPASRRDRMVLR